VEAKISGDLRWGFDDVEQWRMAEPVSGSMGPNVNDFGSDREPFSLRQNEFGRMSREMFGVNEKYKVKGNSKDRGGK
jgi:hypothetical protein